MNLTEKILTEYREQLLPELSNNFHLSERLRWQPCSLAHEILIAKVSYDCAWRHYQHAKNEERSKRSEVMPSHYVKRRPAGLRALICTLFRSSAQKDETLEATESKAQQCFDRAHDAEIMGLKLLAIAYVSGLEDQSGVKTINGIPASLNNQSLKDLFFGFPDEPRHEVSQRALRICQEMQKLKLEL